MPSTQIQIRANARTPYRRGSFRRPPAPAYMSPEQPRPVVGAEASIISHAEGKRLFEERYGGSVLEQAKVAAVITLAAVAAVVSIKVLSPDVRKRKHY